jgi:PTH1 family peptidyl-tRNA hydrolase
MHIIVGLGNPGMKYEGTRHNMGFDVIDSVIAKYHIPQSGTKFHSMYGTGMIEGEKCIVAKPLTYMNLSGTAVRELCDFYKVDPTTNLVVISDDIDTQPGHIRIRKKGSAGGQNGLKDIIAKLGTQEFTRIRIGTGAKPEGWDLADWVLSRFSKEDRELVDSAIARATDAVGVIMTDGVDMAMNRFNG